MNAQKQKEITNELKELVYESLENKANFVVKSSDLEKLNILFNSIISYDFTVDVVANNIWDEQ